MRRSAVIFILFVNTLAYSQFRINVGGGINISDVNYEDIKGTGFDDIKTKAASNYFLSIRPEIGILENFTLVLDAQYSPKGYKTDTMSNTELETRLHYLDVLPQVQYKLLKYMGIYAGCGLTYVLKEENRSEGKWTKFPFEINNPTTITYLAGIRFFPSDRISLQTHVSTNRINHIQFTDVFGNPIDFKARLFNVQIGVAYRIL